MKFLSLLIFISHSLFAGGDLTNLQGVGMARTYTTVSRGINAVGINPANLGYPDKSDISFNLINFGTKIGSDIIDLKIYDKYFTGDNNGNPFILSDADKKKIINLFPDGIALNGLDFELKLLSLSYHHPKIGGFAFSVTEKAGFNLIIPKDYIQFLFYGNPLGSRFDFSKTYFNSMWLREYSLSYGRNIPHFKFMQSMAAGITIKLIHGYGIADLNRNTAYFSTDKFAKISGVVDYRARFAGIDLLDENSNAEFSVFPRPAGHGFGFDIGVSGFVNDQLSVGIALVDMGGINWKHNTYEHSNYAEFDFDDPKIADKQLDTLQKLFEGRNIKISGFSSNLPTTLRFGAAYQLDKAPFINSFPGELIVAFDYNQGFTDYTGSTTAPRFSLGIEYKPFRWLPIRTGVSLGGRANTNMGFGFGFLMGFLDIEFASDNFEAVILPKSANRVSFAFGMKLRI